VYMSVEHSAERRIGMACDVGNRDGKVLVASRVSFTSPQVDNSTQTVLVKARIANGNDALRQAQFVRAQVIFGTHQNPEVPILSVSRLAGQYFAFIAEPEKGGYVARQKPIKVGQTVGNNLEVLEGVKPGDKVVGSGTARLE